MTFEVDTRQWAWQEFGDAELGDRRRVTRLVDMAARLAERPGGRISDVYVRPGESQGAYDFVSNDAVSPAALVRAVGVATARRCAEYDRVVVPIDGSSLTLSDHRKRKNFGPVATSKMGTRGLKTMEAAAVGSDGVFLGVLDVQWWARGSAIVRRVRRPIAQRETQRWVDAISNAMGLLDAEAPSTRVCFVLDREADARSILKELQDTGQEFVVRSRSNRRLVGTTRRLRARVYRAAALGTYTLTLPRTGTRAARTAHLEIRATRVTIWERAKRANNAYRIPINVVCIRELSGPSRKRLHWILLTNRPIDTLEQAKSVARDYTMRWAIEEFHRTWKKGHCNVEQTQLRDRAHVIR
jgi:hypothetical protein